jgi:hypothetical protein
MLEHTILNGLKPVFSGHETFPLRYGWLKKVYDACLELENHNNYTIVKDLFNNEEAIAILGVGKNMVSSMKHWAIYSSLLDSNEKTLTINKFARLIFDDEGLDPWMENFATLWYIHWNLVTKVPLFTYFWFFNYWNINTFDKDTMSVRIVETLKNNDVNLPALSTIKRDIECFLGVYAARSKRKRTDEESIESPLTELELLSPVTRRDLFQINRGVKPTLSIYSFIYGLLMFWCKYSPNASTLSFESICYEPFSPGKIFLLNEDAIAEYMQDIAKETNDLLEYSETAGMKQILLKKKTNFEKEAYKFFKRNYT